MRLSMLCPTHTRWGNRGLDRGFHLSPSKNSHPPPRGTEPCQIANIPPTLNRGFHVNDTQYSAIKYIFYKYRCRLCREPFTGTTVPGITQITPYPKLGSCCAVTFSAQPTKILLVLTHGSGVLLFWLSSLSRRTLFASQLCPSVASSRGLPATLSLRSGITWLTLSTAILL